MSTTPLVLSPDARVVFTRIRRAIDRHGLGARTALVYAACSAYAASGCRAAGGERQYAILALRTRRYLADSLCLQPTPPVPALARAIEALLRGQCAAALGHLEHIEHAGVDRRPVTEGATQ